MKIILIIAVFESFQCIYPKILDLKSLVKKINWCIDTFCLEEKIEWEESWHDTVLVNYNRKDDEEKSMMRWHIAWLWYLFIMNILGSLLLALIQWFKYKKYSEWKINIYLINKTEKYKIIKLSIIEYEIYLIPNFDSIESINLWRKIIDKRTKVLYNLNIYDKFVINNHLNPINFNMIY